MAVAKIVYDGSASDALAKLIAFFKENAALLTAMFGTTDKTVKFLHNDSRNTLLIASSPEIDMVKTILELDDDWTEIPIKR